jgi:hypothetical protein
MVGRQYCVSHGRRLGRLLMTCVSVGGLTLLLVAGWSCQAPKDPVRALGGVVDQVDGGLRVTLTGWKGQEADYDLLRNLSPIVELYMAQRTGAAPISDKVLTVVGSLTSLRELDLDGTAISGSGLAALAGLKSLEVLHLQRTAITDADLQQLQGLTALRDLYLVHPTNACFVSWMPRIFSLKKA